MESRTVLRGAMAVGTIALVCFIIIVISTPPASVYEVSLYSAYHPITWVAFTTALICYFSLLLFKYYRIQAVIGIIALYSIFLSLPLFRGYVLFAMPYSDLIYHYSIVADVIANGTVPSTFYPATHILLSVIVLVTGISLSALQSIAAITFTTILILGIVVAGRRLSELTVGPYLLLAALPLIYTQHHLSIHPWFFTITLIPLVIFVTVVYSRLSQQMAVAGLILTSATIIYHPLTAIFGLIAITVTICSSGYVSGTSIRRAVQQSIYSLIPAVALLYWIFHFDRVQRSILLFAHDDFNQQGSITYIDQATETGEPLWRLIWEFLILQWGTVTIYMSLASLIVTSIIIRHQQDRAMTGEIIITIIFIAGVAFGAVFALLDVFARNPLRISQFGLVVTSLLIGITLWLTFDQNKLNIFIGRKRIMTIASVIIIATILMTALLATGTLYNDNHHLTETTLEGTGWHLDHHDRSQPTYSQRMAFNLELYHHGYTMAHRSERVFSRYDPNRQLPNRLGYRSHTSVGEWAGNGYLITKHDDIAWSNSHSQDRQTNANHYTQHDIQRLKDDSAAQSIYENGAYRIWTTSSPD